MRPSRNGCSVPFGSNSQTVAPVLTTDGAYNFAWTWTGINPPKWGLCYGSVLLGVTDPSLVEAPAYAEEITEFDPADRSGYAPFDNGPGYVYIVGVDMWSNELTPRSNVVYFPG